MKSMKKFVRKKYVICSAADLKCTWKGTRDELTKHTNNCAYEQFRPIISEHKHEIQTTTTTESQYTIDILIDQVEFLLKVINRGNFMRKMYNTNE